MDVILKIVVITGVLFLVYKLGVWVIRKRKAGLCDCGEYKKCPREITVDGNGNVDVKNHFECIKIQRFNTKLNKWWNKK
jgi:hypothetical protein